MSPPSFYAVPSDDMTPYPVEFCRLQQAVLDLGHDPELIRAEGSIGLIVEEVPFLLCFDDDHHYLSIRSFWDTQVPFSETSAVLAVAADSWNRERYFPTIYPLSTSAESLEVVADFLVDLRQGLSDLQLADSLRVALSTGVDAIHYVQDAAYSLLDIEFPFPTRSAHFEVKNGE